MSGGPTRSLMTDDKPDTDRKIVGRRAKHNRGIDHIVLSGDSTDATTISELDDTDISIRRHTTATLGNIGNSKGESDVDVGNGVYTPDADGTNITGRLEAANLSTTRPVSDGSPRPNLFGKTQEGDR